MDHIPASSSPQDAPKLEPKHRAELAASGLSNDTIAAAGIYTARDGAIKEILGWQPKPHRWGQGIVYPYHNLDGSPNGYRRVKLDHPRFRKGKEVKYESPLNTPNRAYFPPGFAKALESKDRPLLITEGEKKALALAQLGFAVIGLVGVWGFQEKRKRDDHGNAYGERRLIPDLGGIELRGRKVIIVFDSDTAANRNNQLAEARLAELLAKHGAEVRAARIPAEGELKVGVDDFLVAHGDAGPAELLKLIDAAEPAELPKAWAVMDWAKALIDDQFMRPGFLSLRWWRDEFYIWTGTHYRKVEDSELQARVLRWLDKREAPARPRFAGEVLGCLESLTLVAFTREQPCLFSDDRSENYPDPANIIAFKNGLLDVTNIGGELAVYPHTPRWFSSASLPYAFDPHAKCPGWLAFLDQVLEGDPERIRLLQHWFGLLLTADTSYQKLLLMIGPPRSGKGTITRIIFHVFGEAACTAATLTSLGGEFGLWPLVGKTIALFPDAHIGRAGDAIKILETVKSIVGEDPQNINRKFLRPLSGVRLPTRFVVTMNELPQFSDASGALAARLSVLPFHKSFVGKEDRKLEGRLKAEAPGILNWALQGLHGLREQGGFEVPAKSAGVIENYLRLSSPVEAFLRDCCETGAGKQVECSELFESWQAWEVEQGHRPISQALFGERLRAARPSIDRTRPWKEGPRPYWYTNVGLNADGRRLLERSRAEKAVKTRRSPPQSMD